MRRAQMVKYFLLLLALAAVCGSPAFARQHEQSQSPATASPPAERQPSTEGEDSDEISAVPNRPTLATTAEAVQRGVLEMEYGFEGGRGHQNINGLVKFGLFKNLEIRAFHNPFERDGGIAAGGDCGAGFKWKVFPQKGRRPTFSVLYSAFFPTAGNGLGIDATGHQVLLLATKDFGKQHFDVNEGVNYLGRVGAGGFDRNYFSALSWSTSFTRKWGVTAEIAGFSRASADNPASLILLAAPTYNLKPWMVLDMGAYYAAYGNYPRWTFFAGVTYAIADLYHRRLANRPAHR